MRSFLLLILAALIVPTVAAPLAQGAGVVEQYQGTATMKRYGGLGSVRCQNPAATIRVDVVTPARAPTPAGGLAFVTVEGGLCGDANETFLATPAGPTGWTLSDPLLKGVGTIARDAAANGTYAVSFALKDAGSRTDAHAFVEVRATAGVQRATLGES